MHWSDRYIASKSKINGLKKFLYSDGTCFVAALCRRNFKKVDFSLRSKQFDLKPSFFYLPQIASIFPDFRALRLVMNRLTDFGFSRF